MAEREVRVGDRWAQKDVKGRSYIVMNPNINTEAGPDSWVMQSDSGIKYMHHNSRMKGEWFYVPPPMYPTRFEREPVI
jgi:hypothetical protein